MAAALDSKQQVRHEAQSELAAGKGILHCIEAELELLHSDDNAVCVRSILQVEGSGWDVGEAVTFLSSDAARWITGLIMPVDAGATAGRAPDLAGGAPPS